MLKTTSLHALSASCCYQWFSARLLRYTPTTSLRVSVFWYPSFRPQDPSASNSAVICRHIYSCFTGVIGPCSAATSTRSSSHPQEVFLSCGSHGTLGSFSCGSFASPISRLLRSSLGNLGRKQVFTFRHQTSLCREFTITVLASGTCQRAMQAPSREGVEDSRN